MNVNSIRESLNLSIANLFAIKEKILKTEKFSEEIIRIHEMTVLLLSFESLTDDEIQDRLFQIDRMNDAIKNYIEFMNSSF
ncbi:hypothetical protein EA58_14630 [Photobacterium galatheae]|uniref:Uncharacterized protein n=1 Tax=Photobacterium galatheae TaxID=1654360 RepID=A0A066RKV9_9GAMM|nr:hypothetical protein EA58_14630 [Photobacterium galatheae]